MAANLATDRGTFIAGLSGDYRRLTGLLHSRATDVAVADIALLSGNLTDWLRELGRAARSAGAELALFSEEVPAVAVIEFAARLGIRSFVCGADLRQDSCLVARALRSGDGWVSPRIGAALVRQRAAVGATCACAGPAAWQAPRFGTLTERERAVLPLIALGHTDVEIAGRLRVSESTVKYHVGNLLAKFGGRNRAHLVTLAGCPAADGHGATGPDWPIDQAHTGRSTRDSPPPHGKNRRMKRPVLPDSSFAGENA
ncbi:helix-turn-helix transcriptional regulator [Streptomyces specialis]|uniref:helix-turn-helix transcriptional regulator n=1 Tax=Streptomyces specialis TaxID=498367 RepID=UPI00073EA606|nr:LuxR C-terminal-related transcriptional regulator [Streptomyces specialis]